MENKVLKARLNVENLKPREVVKSEDKVEKKPRRKKLKFDPENNPFICRNAVERMEDAKNMDIPNKLLGDLIYERTVCILFAETGLGKSTLAYQLADAITRGESIGFLENESDPQKVMIVDFENRELIFRSRYSEHQVVNGKKLFFNEYDFLDTCYFLDTSTSDTFEVPPKEACNFWLSAIEYHAEKSGAKIIFIDNLMSIINEGGGIETTKEVVPLLNGFKNLKEEKGFTIIVVHHTIKRDRSVLTRNHLAGSGNLSNLVDGVIGIDKSNYDIINNTYEDKIKNLSSRYIIQLKPTRFSPQVYGEHNVITARLKMLKPNFIGFELVELSQDDPFRNASEHISNPYSPDTVIYNDAVKNENLERIKELIKENPELSYREMEKRLKEEGSIVSHVTIGKYVKQLEIELSNENNV